MDFNKHKTNKFIKKSDIDNNEIPNTEGNTIEENDGGIKYNDCDYCNLTFNKVRKQRQIFDRCYVSIIRWSYCNPWGN